MTADERAEAIKTDARDFTAGLVILMKANNSEDQEEGMEIVAAAVERLVLGICVEVNEAVSGVDSGPSEA